MKARLLRLRHELGPAGFAALAVFAATAAFAALVLAPLEDRSRLLKHAAAKSVPAGTAPEKVAAVYRFLEKSEQTTDWLAKLHGIGAATGVELRSASYRSQKGAGRVERYEIVLPASGSYPQIREFLRRALAEIPVMSLDQMTLKRESRNDGALRAELRLTLHMVKP